MTDITSDSVAARRMSRSSATQSTANGSTRSTPEEASRVDLVACVELLFFAYRDFTSGPDAVLEEYGFGRAHHRVLHFVHRNPGLRVADLLDILKITKQSLARVLKQLIDKGFIMQRAGNDDRRERRLFVTAKGGRLPVNPSGGLKAKGHPIGATGVSMHALTAMQLMGEAGGIQVEGARLGGIFNMGGAAVANYVSILERIR